jgi:hypothetical protein
MAMIYFLSYYRYQTMVKEGVEEEGLLTLMLA